MYTFFKLKSHVFDNNRGDQLLVDHLKGVSKIALNTSSSHGVVNKELEEVIRIITMCHDFGKASSYFQKYLQGKYNGELKNHGEISAYLTYYLLPSKWKIIGFICVKKHHGDIDIDNSFFASINEENLIRQIKDIRSNISELNKIYKIDLTHFFESIENKSLIKEVKIAYIKRNIEAKKQTLKENTEEFIWCQYLWSLLLTADKTQLINNKVYRNKDILKENFINNYKENLRMELVNKIPNIENTLLFRVRDEIYQSVIKSINDLDLDNEKKLSINVPTGTGKTISVYGAAFRLSERLIKEKGFTPSIIYNIPFMSVIDQNYDVLENIITSNEITIYDDLILKHHSMSAIEYIDNEEKEYRNYDARFLVENWQSTIITTTFVQLFNTIFKSGKNSIMHRFHKLAGSIIILDEVQAIPPKYYGIIEDVFDILCKQFNCYVISVTATKPLFLIGKELVSNNSVIFSNMNRITMENYTNKAIYLNEFKQIVLADIKNNNNKSFLVILNTVKSTFDVYQFLKEIIVKSRNIIYLSTEIIPFRRLEIIKEIKNSSDKYVLISTQLIEAGVDLDFDIVYRDIAPIDSINQSAGRANRNGVNGKGVVKIYKLLNDKDTAFSSYVYSGALLHATDSILKGRDIIKEEDIFKINELYFKKLKDVTFNKERQEYEKYCDYIKGLLFQNIRKFELIEENKFKIDVIIRYNDEVEENINKIENHYNYEEQKILNAWKILSKYKISVNKNEIEDMVHEIKGSYFINKDDYDKNKGIIRRNCIIT